MQSRNVQSREQLLFGRDPGGFILFYFGKLRELKIELLDQFEDVEEYRFLGHHPNSIESILGGVLEKDLDACIAECESDIRNDQSIAGNEDAIVKRISRCKEDLRLLAIKSIAQI